MLEGKRVLGICMTKIHDRVRGELLDKINQAAVKAGYKLICYNSFDDFYRGDVYSLGARTVYNLMDFTMLDGLIIDLAHFCDESLIDELVRKAKDHKLPVMILDGEKDGCISVYHDCNEAFRALVRHVLTEHKVTDVFFIGGRRDNDPDTRQRLECYRDALAECNVPFRENRVDYGEYWDEPAMQITENLIGGGCLPQAIICANDSMAFGVCRKLKEHGYSIPEDVIVTGFDGIPDGQYYFPRLTTCKEHREAMADICIKVFQKIFAGEPCEESYEVPYELVISESCGCVKPALMERNEEASKLCRYLVEMEAHEDYVTSEVEQMLNVESVQELYQPLSRFIMSHSWFCIDSSFLKLTSSEPWKAVSNVMVPCSFDWDHEVRNIPEGQILPEINDWLNDETCYVITAVFSKDIYCGYYAAKVSDVNEVNFKIKKISRLANLVFTTLINLFQQKKMMQDMENAVYLDTATKLPNLKGASKWFEEFAATPRNHWRSLSLAVYELPQYSFIYENYGMPEIEAVMKIVAEIIEKIHTGRDCFVAKISENSFLTIHFGQDPANILADNERLGNEFQAALDDYNKNAGRPYSIEVSSGCTVADAGWTGSLGAFVKYASNEMFLGRLKDDGPAPRLTGKKAEAQIDYMSVFNLLVEHNLFAYHFQPIVDARTGDIYGYEALMRTSGGISLTPLEILDAANEYDRLDEIEHATFFNILREYDERKDEFQGRKVFINTIPNHFVSDEECIELNEKYREYMDCVVLEVTEQSSCSDEEMDTLKGFWREGGEVRIAIDDFGTGHSNIVNLLRYAPQIIKIDRYLISGIESDVNKQMFVKNTIDFASMNQIKVLAEGVETSEEMRTVIDFGVDLIQGYYTGRPAPDPVKGIDEKIKNEIIRENLTLSMYDNDKQKVYTAKDGEELNLVNLALQKYNYIHIVSGRVKLIGKKDSSVSLIVRVADNADAELVCVEANLAGTDEPAIQLGKGSNVVLSLTGYNSINKNGIMVPSNAKLRITGGGNLLVNSNDNYCVGIGSNRNTPYGEIIFQHTGRVKVISSGDRIVGVGGGYGGSPIAIMSGHLEVAGSGISVVGIGSAMGEAFIRVGDAEVVIKESGNEAVGIGTIKGSARIITEGKLNVTADGEKTVAIGSMFGAENVLKLEKGTITGTIHCDMGSVIGSYSGGGKTFCKDCDISVYAEGMQATGIGSSLGTCTTEISGGFVDVKVLSGMAQPFGNYDDQVIITGGNVISRNDYEIPARNAYGQRLHRELKDGDSFEQVIRTDRGDYVYEAHRSKEHEMLSVYLP